MHTFFSFTGKRSPFRRMEMYLVLTATVAVSTILNGCQEPSGTVNSVASQTLGGGAGLNEEITTFTVRLTPVGGGAVVSATSEDLDGVNGPLPTTLQTLTLKAGTAYTGTFEALNKLASPPEDVIEADVFPERDVHQFFFAPDARLTVSNLDTDTNGLPFGLNFTLSVTGGGGGTSLLRVELRHWEDGGKPASAFTRDVVAPFPVNIEP